MKVATKKFALATKSKNLGASWPQGFFLKSSPDYICTFLPPFKTNLDFLQAVKLQNLAIIWYMTKQVRGMGLFLG